MVTIENKQNIVIVDIMQLRKDARYLLGLLDYKNYDLGIWLIDNPTMQQYNKQYRNKDVPTDVLSFAFHNLKPGERINALCEDDKNLGDLMMSLEFVQAQYPDNYYARVQKLLVHGICHLLGHDHDTDATDKEMLELEDILLEKLLMHNAKKAKIVKPTN